jgi:hypothetical protein
VEVDEDTITIIIKEQDGDVFIEKERGPMNRITKNKYVYVVSNMRQRFHEYTITVKDVNGHEASLSGYFEVN